MPRVLHLYKDVYPPVFGGIEVVLGKLAALQAAQGWEVGIAVSGPVDQSWGAAHGLDVQSVGEVGRLLSNPLTTGFLRALRGQAYDCLHVHLPCPTAVLSVLLAANRRVPWFASYQSDIVRQRLTGALYTPLQKAFLRRCAAVFVSSPPMLESSPVLASLRGNCRIVPLGISSDPPSQQAQNLAAEIRARHKGRPIILFVGRFRWYKGLPILLEAMDQVDADLVVVGGATGKREQEIYDLVNRLRHPERIHLVGSSSSVEPYLLAGDIFCLPSTHRAEAFGYVLLEAFRCGLPAVTTELGTGTSFVNQHEVTGLVVRPHDVDGLAQALNRLVEDETLRSEYGVAARKRVVSEFHIDRMVESILQAYCDHSGV